MPATAKMKPMKINSFTLPFLRLLATRWAKFKRTMQKLTAILIFLIFGTVTFGQLSFLPNDISKAKKLLPDKIKTIRQYKGDLLLNVREYDTLKNDIVPKNWTVT